MKTGTGKGWKTAVEEMAEKADDLIGPDGLKLDMEHEIAFDPMEWASNNPLYALAGLGLIGLVVRKLIQ